jgi:membrane protease YdiL (CAAX protease family)
MEAEHPLSTRDVIVSLLFTLAVLIGVSILAVTALGFLYGSQPPKAVLSATLLVLTPTSIGLCGIFFARQSSQGAGRFLGLAPGRLYLLVPGVVLAGQLSETLYRWIHSSAEILDGGAVDSLAAAVQQPGILGAVILLGAMVLAPIGEELFFRGWLYGAFRSGHKVPVAIVASGVAFAAYHMDPAHSIAILPLALWLSWLRWATGSLLPCILAHGLNNVLWVLSTRLWPEADPLPLWFTGLCAVGLVAMLTYVGRRPPKEAM